MKAMKPLRAPQPCRPGELCHVCFPNSSFPLGRNRPKGPGSKLPARAGDEAKLWHGQSRVWARFGNRFDLLSTKTLPFAGAGAVTPKAYFNFASIPLSQGARSSWRKRSACLEHHRHSQEMGRKMQEKLQEFHPQGREGPQGAVRALCCSRPGCPISDGHF